MKLRISYAPCAVAALAVVALSSCRSSAHYSHWSNKSIGPQVTYQALGYDPTQDGNYGPFFKHEMSDLGVTLRRHFLCENPDNPLVNN